MADVRAEVERQIAADDIENLPADDAVTHLIRLVRLLAKELDAVSETVDTLDRLSKGETVRTRGARNPGGVS
jgi:inactivated superfamily I helicase